MTYAEKLKNPKWQRKRLEILQRDDFSCQMCYDEKKTLHVHHKLYIKGNDPWDYSDESLITLCEDCHDIETHDLQTFDSEAIVNLKTSSFFAADLLKITQALREVEPFYCSSITADALCFLLENDHLLEPIVQHYLKST